MTATAAVANKSYGVHGISPSGFIRVEKGTLIMEGQTQATDATVIYQGATGMTQATIYNENYSIAMGSLSSQTYIRTTVS